MYVCFCTYIYVYSSGVDRRQNSVWAFVHSWCWCRRYSWWWWQYNVSITHTASAEQQWLFGLEVVRIRRVRWIRCRSGSHIRCRCVRGSIEWRCTVVLTRCHSGGVRSVRTGCRILGKILRCWGANCYGNQSQHNDSDLNGDCGAMEMLKFGTFVIVYTSWQYTYDFEHVSIDAILRCELERIVVTRGAAGNWLIRFVGRLLRFIVFIGLVDSRLVNICLTIHVRHIL